MSEETTSDVPPEEDFLPAPPRPPHPFDVWPSLQDGRVAFVHYGLAVLLSLYHWQVFYSLSVSASALSASYDSVFERGEYWRLVTAIFAHAGFEHLLNNSLTLIIFSWILSAYFGRWAFPLGGLMIGIVSNAVTLIYYGPGVSLLGASGMNYGLVAMWLCLYLRFDQTSRLPHRVMRAIGFAMMMLIPQQYDPKVSYMAHASGFACGLVLGLIGMNLWSPQFPPHASLKKFGPTVISNQANADR
jgi:rhomboid protease GluP